METGVRSSNLIEVCCCSLDYPMRYDKDAVWWLFFIVTLLIALSFVGKKEFGFNFVYPPFSATI